MGKVKGRRGEKGISYRDHHAVDDTLAATHGSRYNTPPLGTEVLPSHRSMSVASSSAPYCLHIHSGKTREVTPRHIILAIRDEKCPHQNCLPASGGHSLIDLKRVRKCEDTAIHPQHGSQLRISLLFVHAGSLRQSLAPHHIRNEALFPCWFRASEHVGDCQSTVSCRRGGMAHLQCRAQ